MKRISIVHDWIDTAGGAENVCDALVECLNPSQFFCLLADKRAPLSQKLEPILTTSSLQSLPFAFRFHRYLLGFYPKKIEDFDLRDSDLIVSSSHCVAKGVLTRADQLHISYIHTPARYLWDQYQDYLEWNSIKGLKALYVKNVFHKMRQWDVASSSRVDLFVANSHHVAKRIWKTYRRPSIVVHPFVNLEKFNYVENRQIKKYFVVLSRLVSQKRVDVAVRACSRLGVPLKIVGDGPLLAGLRAQAGDCVEFLGRLEPAELSRVLSGAQGLIFPQEEDFGIVPLEAHALGVPVLALKKGGACETVVDGVTGRFFDSQQEGSLEAALERWSVNDFDPRKIRAQAEKFSKSNFMDHIRYLVEEAYAQFNKDGILNDQDFVAEHRWPRGSNVFSQSKHLA